jgi:hypothetical protein
MSAKAMAYLSTCPRVIPHAGEHIENDNASR